MLRVDIAFVIHAWFIQGVTRTWWCPRFHGQSEHIVSPLPKVDLVLSLTLQLSLHHSPDYWDLIPSSGSVTRNQ